jgi:hypothetical protein
MFVSSALTWEDGRDVSRHHRSSVTDLLDLCEICGGLIGANTASIALRDRSALDGIRWV